MLKVDLLQRRLEVRGRVTDKEESSTRELRERGMESNTLNSSSSRGV